MNKGNAKDFLPLVQALADGKTIQMADGVGGWNDIYPMGRHFLYAPDQYRIKPEPREILVTQYRDGCVTQVRYREVIE